MLSSLLQLPFVASTPGPGRSIGLICADRAGLTPELVAKAYPHASRAVQVAGLEDAPASRSAILDEEGELDTAAVEAEVVERARALVRLHPECGAILLECSNLPPYAAAVQRETGLHVYDF